MSNESLISKNESLMIINESLMIKIELLIEWVDTQKISIMKVNLNS